MACSLALSHPERCLWYGCHEQIVLQAGLMVLISVGHHDITSTPLLAQTAPDSIAAHFCQAEFGERVDMYVKPSFR